MPRFLATFWQRLTLVARLLATASFALLIAGMAMIVVSAWQEAYNARSDLKTELLQELEILPPALAEVVVIGDFASLQQQLDRYVVRADIDNIIFFDNSGIVLESRDKPVPALAPDWFFESLRFGNLSGKANITVGGRSYGEITIALTAQRLANRTWHRLLNHLAILLLAIGLNFIGIWLVLRRGLLPLKRLESGAEAIADGALDTRLALEGSPELRRLIAAFNRMAAAAQGAQDHQRMASAELQRFAEVTAHHLQEPARRMASYAERLTTQLTGRIDDPEAQLSLDFIGQQARRMKHLLGDIERYLAAGQPRGKIDQSDVGKTLGRILERLAKRIAETGTVLTVGDLPPARIDAPRLADLFEVAVENALCYGATAEARIRIDGERDGAFVRYRVSDNGPGIEAQYRERVFRVFERLTPGGDATSTGIGLAIVRRIVESCEGRAWIEETPGGGCRLLFELPAEEIT